MADPAYRSSSSASGQTAATFSVAKPAGTADGDKLVAFQATNLAGGSAPATPSGWALNRDQNSAGSPNIREWLKTASSEPASWTFYNASGGIGSTSSVYVVAVSGAPNDGNGNTGSGTGTTADAGPITTLAANSLLLGGWAIGANAGDSITPHASWTALGVIGDTSHELNVGYKSQAAAGSTSDTNATLGVSVGWVAAIEELVNPSPPPPPSAAAPYYYPNGG